MLEPFDPITWSEYLMQTSLSEDIQNRKMIKETSIVYGYAINYAGAITLNDLKMDLLSSGLLICMELA